MRLLLTLAAALLAAAPAYADPQTAERVVRELLGPGTTSGAFETRSESGRERVRVPDVVKRIGDERIWVGAVEFLIAPDSHPQRHRFEVTFPGEIVLTDEQGAPKGTLRLGENRFSGIWSDERTGVMASSLLWRDVSLSDAAGSWSGAIDQLEARSEGDLDSPTWTGRLTLSAHGLRFSLGHDVTIQADEATLEYRGDNVPYAAWAALDTTGLGAPQGRELSRDERERLASLLFALPGFGDRISAALRVGSFSASAGGQSFGFAGLGIEEGLARERGDTIEATVGIAVDGLTLPLEVGVLGPDRGGLTLRIGRIPGGALVHALAESILRDDKVDALGAAFDTLLNASAATLKLDGALGGSSYSAVLASAFRIDPSAARDIVGDAHATIAGLDETLASISRPPATAERQRAAAMLALLKAFGAPRSDNGATLYDYRLSMDAAGKLTLNGRDLGEPMALAPSGRP